MVASWGASLAAHAVLIGFVALTVAHSVPQAPPVEPPTQVFPTVTLPEPERQPPGFVTNVVKAELPVVRPPEPDPPQQPPGSPPDDPQGPIDPGSPQDISIGTNPSVPRPERPRNRRAILGSEHGASSGSETAVGEALRWFKRHQSSDGRWDPVTYLGECTEAVKCEPGQYDRDTGSQGTTIAITAYALLCFFGAEYDHLAVSTYKATVAKGLDWLLLHQQVDGSFGTRTYEHAIATLALADALILSRDGTLRAPLTRAVKVLVARQHRGATTTDRLGWSYHLPEIRQDASVTGWAVLALSRARDAGIPATSEALLGARAWLDRHWLASNQPATPSEEWKTAAAITTDDKSRFAYTWRCDTGSIEMEPVASAHGGQHSLEGVGLLSARHLGHSTRDPLVASLVNTIEAHQVPVRYPCNTYYLYDNTYGLFQVGGETWKTWNARVRDLLVSSQRRNANCLTGSWDANDTVFWGNQVGRLLHTAYCTLALEVYYRYDRLPD